MLCRIKVFAGFPQNFPDLSARADNPMTELVSTFPCFCSFFDTTQLLGNWPHSTIIQQHWLLYFFTYTSENPACVETDVPYPSLPRPS